MGALVGVFVGMGSDGAALGCDDTVGGSDGGIEFVG